MSGGARRAAGAGLALAAVVCAAGAVARTQAADVVVAVDEGTHLQPIARLAGGGWVEPAAARGTLPRAWTRWRADGTSVSLATVPAGASGACLTPAPGASRPASPASGPAAAQAGLAVSGGIAVEAASPVSALSEEGMRLLPTITSLFASREREQRLTAATIVEAPMTVDWLYAAGGGARAEVYYFEASKRIPQPPDIPTDDDVDPRGILRIAVAGWIAAADGRVTPLASKGELRWEQEDEQGEVAARPDLTPLGILREGGQPIWVMKGYAGLRASYALYETGAAGVRTILTARAADC